MQAKNLMWLEQERHRSLIECDYCDLSCKPHYELESDELGATYLFCSRACAEEWVRERTGVHVVDFKITGITCAQCQHVNPLISEPVFILVRSPFIKAYGKKFCSPDCAHDYIDSMLHSKLKIIRKNVIGVNAQEFAALTNMMSDPYMYQKLADFEGRRDNWYRDNPKRLLTAPTEPEHSPNWWSPTVDYLTKFVMYCQQRNAES